MKEPEINPYEFVAIAVRVALLPFLLLCMINQCDASEVEKGRSLYVANCISCHNRNPHLPGNVGPDLYTTPREVFLTKVPTGQYPKGYTPKRKTRIMPKLKHLESKVNFIYTYIQSVKK